MKKSAAVPSGAAKKRRDLTNLMPITFARYLASLTVYVASSQSAPFMRSFVARPVWECQAVRRSELHGGRPRAFLRVDRSLNSPWHECVSILALRTVRPSHRVHGFRL